jgi:uncharacterized RDD family membrane protein YckC
MIPLPRRSGGIGRRAGLKIRSPRGGVGSSPTSGTIFNDCLEPGALRLMPSAAPNPFEELPPAGFLRRVMAMVYDGLLVLALILTTTGVANLFAPRPDLAPDATTASLEGMQTVTGPFLSSLLFIEMFAFFAFFWVRYGRTLGMQAWRLRVQDSEGHNITLLAALKRFLVAFPSLLLLGLGYWVMLLDPMKRSWSDRASNTRVVLHQDG